MNWTLKVNDREVYGWKRVAVTAGLLTAWAVVWLAPGFILGWLIFGL